MKARARDLCARQDAFSSPIADRVLVHAEPLSGRPHTQKLGLVLLISLVPVIHTHAFSVACLLTLWNRSLCSAATTPPIERRRTWGRATTAIATSSRTRSAAAGTSSKRTTSARAH